MMKKQIEKLNIRKCLAVMMIAVMLCACSNNQPEVTTSTGKVVDTTVEPTKAAEPTAEPTKVEEPVEVEDPGQEEPTPEVTEPVVEGPNVVRGLDFTNFNEGYGYQHDLDDNTYEGIAWAVSTSLPNELSKITYVLFDGDLCEISPDVESYGFLLYTPKRAESIALDEGPAQVVDFGDSDELGNTYNKKFYALILNDRDGTFDNEKFTVTATYDDGTSESITFYLTKQ